MARRVLGQFSMRCAWVAICGLGIASACAEPVETARADARTEEGWTTCEPSSGCLSTQECVSGRCVLRDEVLLDIPFVYLYDDASTYNPDWRARLRPNLDEASRILAELTGGRVQARFDLIGELPVRSYCWTPAIPGVQVGDRLARLPGSTFNLIAELIGDAEARVLDVPGSEKVAIRRNQYGGREAAIVCPDPLGAYDFRSASPLEEEVARALGIGAETTKPALVFGRFGQIDPAESLENLRYRCTTLEGVLGAYSNLWFSENLFRPAGFVDCSPIQEGAAGFYQTSGAESVVHEVLHRLGAVDLYDTSVILGLDVPDRESARRLDPRADESLMGNGVKPCSAGNDRPRNASEATCTLADLETVYLDLLNRRLIGLPDDLSGVVRSAR